MRAYVFTDTTLARHAGRFVWLEIDNENPGNAAFRKRYPTPGLPTFFVLDAAHETVQLRWLGGLTVGQLHALLDDVSEHRGTPPQLLARVARGDSLFGAGAYAAAADAYDAVLAASPPGWRGAPRLVESMLFACTQTHQEARAVALARAWLPALGRSPSALSVAAGALDAAGELPDSLPARAAALAEFLPSVRTLVRDTSFTTAADDRSGAYISLLGAAGAAHDSLGAHAVALEWAAFLESQAARARTPDERAVFDPHRMSAYLELGQPERALPMLLDSEHDLPRDYNPPARLAAIYRTLKRWDEALAASDRAMALAYGPRKLNLFDVRADIFVGRGDPAGARRTLTAAIAYLQALPEEQRSAARLAALQRRLAALGAN